LSLGNCKFPESSVGTPEATKDSRSHEDTIWSNSGDLLNSLAKWRAQARPFKVANSPILLDFSRLSWTLGPLGAMRVCSPSIYHDISRAVQPRAWNYALRRRLVAKQAARGRTTVPMGDDQAKHHNFRRFSLVEPQRSRSDKPLPGAFLALESVLGGLGACRMLLFMQVSSPR
jgi:hypothetical protein